MTFPLALEEILTSDGTPLTFYNGMLTLLGANGTGKTQFLRKIQELLIKHSIKKNKKIKFFSAGRIANIEKYRSNIILTGSVHGIDQARYDKAAFGYKPNEDILYQDETLTAIYHQLVNRPDLLIKIQERLAKLLKKSLHIEWQEGSLQINFADLDSNQAPYSAGREASGLLHLIGLLIALYDDTISVLLIDEPEVSLHPQLQAFLLKEIKHVTGVPEENSYKKLVIIATHSTEMLNITKPTDICNLVFCAGHQQPPIQIKQDDDHLIGKDIKKAILEIGQTNKQIFFCKKPLIVEGRSDQIICEAIADRNTTYLEATGVQILSINGIGKILPTYNLLKLLNKSPIILVDADAIADDSNFINALVEKNKHIIDILDNKSGEEEIKTKVKSIYTDFNKSIPIDIKQLSENFPYYSYYNKAIPKDKEQQGNLKDSNTLINKRLAFCLLFNEPNLKQSLTGLKNRLNNLLDQLEQIGLFVLRKGTIECYYQEATCSTELSKIDIAMDEALYILEKMEHEKLNNYSEILRCIKYSANTTSICEATLIREWLTSINFTLYRLLIDGNTKNYLAKIIEIIGDKGKLFSIQETDNGLLINIQSSILDVAGFPLEITKDDDLNSIGKKIEQIVPKCN